MTMGKPGNMQAIMCILGTLKSCVGCMGLNGIDMNKNENRPEIWPVFTTYIVEEVAGVVVFL